MTTVVISGANRGIGLEFARQYAADGARVIAGVRDPDSARELQDVAQASGGRVSVHRLDVADDGSVQAFGHGLGDEPVDILIANAGVTRDGLLLRMKDEDWETVIRVNLEAYFRLSRAALKGMMKRRSGRIIGITSIVGVTGNPGQANYAASKAGLFGLTKTLALEVARKGITVNCVAPGYTETDMVAAVPKEVLDRLIAGIPVQRMARPEEIARAVLFLADDDAGYITGAVIPVNGGLDM